MMTAGSLLTLRFDQEAQMTVKYQGGLHKQDQSAQK
jgi:hypothetical protein